MAWAEAYLPTKWHLDPSSHLVATNIGRKLGAIPLWGGQAGFPSNTVWQRRGLPTCQVDPSNRLPTIHQRQTDRHTDRQTDKQRSDSIGRTVFGRPFVKRFALCYVSVGCLSCLSVTLVYCGQTVGWIKMKPGMEIGLDPGHTVLDGDPAPPSPKRQTPNFRPMSAVAKRLVGSSCHMVWRQASVQATLC